MHLYSFKRKVMLFQISCECKYITNYSEFVHSCSNTEYRSYYYTIDKDVSFLYIKTVLRLT